VGTTLSCAKMAELNTIWGVDLCGFNKLRNPWGPDPPLKGKILKRDVLWCECSITTDKCLHSSAAGDMPAATICRKLFYGATMSGDAAFCQITHDSSCYYYRQHHPTSAAANYLYATAMKIK